MSRVTSITDTPVRRKEDNLLGIENYAKALGDFILESATPLTIGIQGEWGTGKTSMMSLILEAYAEQNVAVSWINTWEYSLFRDAKETTPAVLRAMLEMLKESCNEYWTISDEVKDRIRKISSLIGNLTNHVVSTQTGIDIKSAVGADEISVYAEIADIKKGISGIVERLIQDPKNKFEKVVFFLDDLDRIDPPVAVEILEALKNIFDIENCVFVLAIDYDIVIKGLERKFGKKTESNEREFRSFFDKIIQVPFSMPIGSYDIGNLLNHQLSKLNLKIEGDLEASYMRIVSLTVGYIPRSIKRYINIYSLLQKIKATTKPNPEINRNLDFCLFALIGIQISYPTIFRLLNINPDFTKWSERLAKQHGIDDLSKAASEDELADEAWEQFIYLYCQKDPYLKSRAFNIIKLFNLLRDTAGDELHDALSGAMDFASITAVDDDAERKQVKSFDPVKRKLNRDNVKRISAKFNNELSRNFNSLGIEEFDTYQARGEEGAYFSSKLNFDDKAFRLEFYFDGANYSAVSYPVNKKSEAMTEKWYGSLKKQFPLLNVSEEWEGIWLYEVKNTRGLSYEEFVAEFEGRALETVEIVFNKKKSG